MEIEVLNPPPIRDIGNRYAAFRRMRLVKLVGLGLLLAGISLVAAERPNIIVVITDDQGYGDLGIHGNPHLRTPHIDQFAREGVQLTRFYVSPVCAPTRASLLTGRYHYRTGVTNTHEGGANMHGDEITIAELLRAAGYRTGIFGKWHLGDNYPMRPSEQGFEESLIHKGGGIAQPPDQPSSYFNPRLWHNNQPQPSNGYCTDIFFDAALRYIETQSDRPFFVYLATNTPHVPLEVSAKYSDPYKAMGLEDETARAYGMIENIDENFGRLLAALDRLNLRKDTLMIFLTDNGPQVFRYNAGMRGRKGTTYEGGIRVPFFLQWPARWPGGRKIDNVAGHIDLLPTLLDICGVRLPPDRAIDGKSLKALLSGTNKAEPWSSRILYIQCHRGLAPKQYQHFAAVSQRFKLVGYPDTYGQQELDTSRGRPVLELYDLQADPEEKRDLAAQHPDVVARMRQSYEGWFEDVRETRKFTPGLIEIGADAAPFAHLSRYQDAAHRKGVAHEWLVNVVRGGRYAIKLIRGDEVGATDLVVQWAGKTSRQPLADGHDTAVFELTPGPGKLEVWLESANGERAIFKGLNQAGDVIVGPASNDN